MFSTDFISGSGDFTQHLTSGGLILIHSADLCILVKIARARVQRKTLLSLLKLLTEVSASKVHSISRNLSPKKPASAAAILKQTLSGQVRLGR